MTLARTEDIGTAYFLSPNSEPCPLEQNGYLSVVRTGVIQAILFLAILGPFLYVASEHADVLAIPRDALWTGIDFVMWRQASGGEMIYIYPTGRWRARGTSPTPAVLDRLDVRWPPPISGGPCARRTLRRPRPLLFRKFRALDSRIVRCQRDRYETLRELVAP